MAEEEGRKSSSVEGELVKDEEISQDDTTEQDKQKNEEETREEKQERQSFECSRAYFRHFFLTRILTMNIYWRTLFLSIVTMIYILIGGAIFSAVERPNEASQNQAMVEANETYYRQLGLLVEIIANNTNFTTEQASALVEGVGKAAVNVSSFTVADNWLYGSAVFFVTTVVTTIGEHIL